MTLYKEGDVVEYRPFGAKQALTGTISKIEATTGGHVDITYTIDGKPYMTSQILNKVK